MGRAFLSKAQNPTSSSGITVVTGGSRLAVVAPGRNRNPVAVPNLNAAPSGGGVRGKITTFTSRSASNFESKLCDVERTAFLDAAFLTLTYPNSFPLPDESQIYKGHLERFKQELIRYFRKVHGVDASGFWRLEFQARGAAHFHFVVFGVGRFRDLKQLQNIPAKETREEASLRRRCFGSVETDLKAIWIRIVDSGDPKHEKKALEMEALKSVAGGISYITSYASKKDQTMDGVHTGRYWGRVNGSSLPLGKEVEFKIPDEFAFTVRRIIRGRVKRGMVAGWWSGVLKRADKRLSFKGRRLRPNKLTRTEFERLVSLRVPVRPDVVLWLKGGCKGARPKGCQRASPEEVRDSWLLLGHFGQSPIRPPSKYRLRNNDRVRLNRVDASGMWDQLDRLRCVTEWSPF